MKFKYLFFVISLTFSLKVFSQENNNSENELKIMEERYIKKIDDLSELKKTNVNFDQFNQNLKEEITKNNDLDKLESLCKDKSYNKICRYLIDNKILTKTNNSLGNFEKSPKSISDLEKKYDENINQYKKYGEKILVLFKRLAIKNGDFSDLISECSKEENSNKIICEMYFKTKKYHKKSKK